MHFISFPLTENSFCFYSSSNVSESKADISNEDSKVEDSIIDTTTTTTSTGNDSSIDATGNAEADESTEINENEENKT